jgi:hypothetical protein
MGIVRHALRLPWNMGMGHKVVDAGERSHTPFER